MISIGFLGVLFPVFVSLQKSSQPQIFPGDIIEYPRNKYFSHFAVYYGDRDGVPYVAHLTCRGLTQSLCFYSFLSLETFSFLTSVFIVCFYRLFLRLRLEAAAFRSSAEVGGEAGSSGAAGEEIQGLISGIITHSSINQSINQTFLFIFFEHVCR